MKSFSFVKLLNAMVNPLDVQAQRNADKELQTVERGKHTGGFVIPPDAVASLDSQRVGVRVLSTAAASGAGVVQTAVMGDSFIDSLLASNYGLQRARIYTGLSGTVEIPTESNVITAGWVDETGSAAEKDPTIGKITLKPKRLGTHVDVSRALLTMGNPDVEDLVKFLLSRAVSNALDNAIFYGSGTAPVPAGIANLSGVNTKIEVTASDAARGDKIFEACVKAEQNLAENNVDESMIEVLMSPAWFYGCRFKSWDGKASLTAKDSKIAILPSRESPLLETYPVTRSGRVSVGGGMFMGDFSQVIVGQWTEGFELEVNPYSLDTQGLVRISILTLADIGFEHAKAFQQVSVS